MTPTPAPQESNPNLKNRALAIGAGVLLAVGIGNATSPETTTDSAALPTPIVEVGDPTPAQSVEAPVHERSLRQHVHLTAPSYETSASSPAAAPVESSPATEPTHSPSASKKTVVTKGSTTHNAPSFTPENPSADDTTDPTDNGTDDGADDGYDPTAGYPDTGYNPSKDDGSDSGDYGPEDDGEYPSATTPNTPTPPAPAPGSAPESFPYTQINQQAHEDFKNPSLQKQKVDGTVLLPSLKGGPDTPGQFAVINPVIFRDVADNATTFLWATSVATDHVETTIIRDEDLYKVYAVQTAVGAPIPAIEPVTIPEPENFVADATNETDGNYLDDQGNIVGKQLFALPQINGPSYTFQVDKTGQLNLTQYQSMK